MVKFITVSGIVVGIIAGLVTVIGTIQGQPDLLGQYAVQISEILDLGIELLRECTEKCFE